MRMLSFVGHISANRIITGEIEVNDWPKMTTAAGQLSDMPLFFDNSPDITVQEIKRKAMHVRERTGLGLILVDSLESIRLTRMTKDSETEHLERARSLKCVARTLNVPLILTANVDRCLLIRVTGGPLCLICWISASKSLPT